MPCTNYAWLNKIRNEDRERLSGVESLLLAKAEIILLDATRALGRL